MFRVLKVEPPAVAGPGSRLALGRFVQARQPGTSAGTRHTIDTSWRDARLANADAASPPAISPGDGRLLAFAVRKTPRTRTLVPSSLGLNPGTPAQRTRMDSALPAQFSLRVESVPCVSTTPATSTGRPIQAAGSALSWPIETSANLAGLRGWAQPAAISAEQTHRNERRTPARRSGQCEGERGRNDDGREQERQSDAAPIGCKFMVHLDVLEGGRPLRSWALGDRTTQKGRPREAGCCSG